MKTLLLMIASFALPICSATANDFGVSGIGGTYFPIKGEHRSIRMVREKVRLDVYQGKNYDQYYDASVDFVFKNDGEATEVEMAFPESAAGADAGYEDESSFRFFRTSVNGKSVNARRIIADKKLSEKVGCQAIWVKKVSFAKGETKAVRVAYRSPWGSLVEAGAFAEYDFTGGNWKGKVDESQITVYLHAKQDKPFQGYFDGNRIEMEENGSFFSYTWKNWEAEGVFKFWFNVQDIKAADEMSRDEATSLASLN